MESVASKRAHAARSLAVFGAVVAVLLALPALSGATMPGLNGRIAFDKSVQTSESEIHSGVWSMNPDGSGATELTAPEDAFSGAYSPDGSRIAFERSERVVVAAANGSGEQVLASSSKQREEATTWKQNYHPPEEPTKSIPWAKVTESHEAVDQKFDPSFSPDGATLALVHYTATFVSRNYCPVSGSGQTNCTGLPEFEFECQDCGSSIEAIDSTTGATRGVLSPRETGIFKLDPGFASTGALLYVQEREDEEAQLLVVLRSPAAAPVVVASGAEVSDPDFSPDGGRIAYRSGRHEISIVAAAGGAPTAIEVPKPAPTDQFWGVSSPIWSPDGTLIALQDAGTANTGSLVRFTDGGVFLMHPDGSGLVQIQGEVTKPTSWQPIPRPPAPPAAVRARALKGKKKLKLNRKGAAVVGKVVCGSSPCALTAAGAKLKLGKKRYGVKATFAKSLAPGATGQVKVKVKGKALAALVARRSGRLTLAVTVADAAGAEKLSFAPKLLPPPSVHRSKGK